MNSHNGSSEVPKSSEPRDYDYVYDFTADPPPMRFRFKSHQRHGTSEPSTIDSHHHHRSKRRRTRSPAEEAEAREDHVDSQDHESRSHRQRTHHHHHHHHHRRKHRTKSPTSTADQSAPSPPRSPPLDPDTAFRESLFDAMADDEGAAFWEGVYGQPIHTYPRPAARATSQSSSAKDEDNLNLMSDEEYTTYVRGKMWEKSHEAVLEERRRREAERRKRKEESERWRREGGRMEEERERFTRDVEESLKRGAERKRERAWADAWKRYTTGWENLLAATSTTTTTASHPQKDKLNTTTPRLPPIPWPTRTANPTDLTAPEITAFFDHHKPHAPADWSLKKERIRWHPDKMQQRFGGARGVLDAEALRGVTAVFQVVDALWGRKEKEGGK